MRWRDPLIAAALTLVVLTLYARTAGFDYVFYDDHEYVFENPRISAGLSADNVRWAFTTFQLANWHPLTWLSYLAEVDLFGGPRPRPGPIHVVNVLFHTANTLLLY